MPDTTTDIELPSQVYLRELKAKSPTDLLAYAEMLDVENASSLRTQDMLFAILKELADQEVDIIGRGVVEVLPDGFGFLRSPESNYLAGPDDIYVNKLIKTQEIDCTNLDQNRFLTIIRNLRVKQFYYPDGIFSKNMVKCSRCQQPGHNKRNKNCPEHPDQPRLNDFADSEDEHQ